VLFSAKSAVQTNAWRNARKQRKDGGESKKEDQSPPIARYSKEANCADEDLAGPRRGHQIDRQQ
jgi:hypothetical protein